MCPNSKHNKLSEVENVATGAGFDPDNIKNYVSTLMDLEVQRKLRDINRNQKFHSVSYKYGLLYKDGKIVNASVICESEEMFFCFTSADI